MQTKGQAAMAAKAAELTPGSLRHQVIQVAQRFKTSWVELGSLLVRVRNEGAWEEWGYKTFEDYCSEELRIKRQTALKLTNSYAFLARHEKSLFDAEKPPAPDQDAPPFEVVSVLAGAEQRGQLSDKDYKELRERIWDDEQQPKEIAKELAQRYPEQPKPAKAAPTPDLLLRRLALAARKLAADMKGCKRSRTRSPRRPTPWPPRSRSWPRRTPSRRRTKRSSTPGGLLSGRRHVRGCRRA
ncbi:MAG: hypothetical protein QM765_03500 [Myxococcales bacterium]